MRSELPNPDRQLKSEMFASFKITTSEGSRAPAVPVESIIWDGDVATVWVETAPKVFRRRVVQVSTQQDGMVQILQGVSRQARRSSRAEPSSSTTSGGNDALGGGLSGECCAVSIAFCLSRRLLVLCRLRRSWASAWRRSRRSTSRPIPIRRRRSSRSSPSTRPVARGGGALRHHPDRDRASRARQA